MKKVRLNDLEESKNYILKQYKLDKDSINEFRSKIKCVSDEESKKNFLDLFNLVSAQDYHDNYEKAIKYIYNGADLNILYIDTLPNFCIYFNHIQTFILLLRAGVDINLVDNKSLTPLMKCAEVGNKEILELLILMGADINIKNEVGNSALSIAIKNNHKECANILINAQAHLNCTNISNINVIDTNKSGIYIPELLDKSLYSSKEDKDDVLIKEAENKLNDVVNSKIIYNNPIINNISLLDIDYVREHKLKIFKESGLKAIMTDFAILLGGYAESSNSSKNDNYTLRTGSWWLGNVYDEKKAFFIDIDGDILYESSYIRTFGIRPVIPYHLIESDESGKLFNEVYYGEYPQEIVGTSLSDVLESQYQRNILKLTGKSYTSDSINFQDTTTSFDPTKHIEYIYESGKYVRIVGNSNCVGEALSNNRIIEKGKPYWVKVLPIKWLIDHDTKIVISKKLLISGLQFNPKFVTLIYEYSSIIKYLNEIFAKEIIPSKLNNSQKDGLSDESKKVLRRLYRDLNGF